MTDLFSNLLQQITLSAPESLDEGGQLYVGCSGGVDSMLLLDILVVLANTKGWRQPVVLHVNYGLRADDSLADENLVRLEAERRNLICHVRTVSSQENPKLAGDPGIQDWARQIRRQWFASWLTEGDVLAVGHHQDDLAENILIRLGRGTSLRLAGMEINKRPYWRPLLPWNKETIRLLASRQKVSFREDGSNGKLDYSRNYVRWKVIPEFQARFSDVVPKLTGFAEDLNDIANYLEQQFADSIEAPYLVASQVRSLNRGLGFFVLAAFLRRQIGHYPLSRALLGRVWGNLQKTAEYPQLRWREELAGQYTVHLADERLSIVRSKQAFRLRAQQHRANILRHVPGILLEDGAIAHVDLAYLRRRRSDREDLDSAEKDLNQGARKKSTGVKLP